MEGNVVTNDAIADLIQSANQSQAAAHAEREAKYAAYRKDCEGALRESLGEALWAQLFEHMRGEYKSDRQDYYTLYVHVEAPELQLAPITFKVADSRRFDTANHDFTSSVALASSFHFLPIERLGEVLADARRQFPKWNADRLEKLTMPVVVRLVYTRPNGARTAQEADAVLAELNALDPENTSKWQELRKDWDTWMENFLHRQAEEKRARHDKEQELDRYAQDLESYCRKYLDTLSINRAKCQALQDRLETSVHYWKMTYALLGEDEGERMVDTHYVFVAEPDPDEQGYWKVFERGAIHPTRYMNPVSVEGPLETSVPSGISGVIGSWFAPDTDGFTIYYRPGLDIATAVKALHLQELPEAPSCPQVSYQWECERMDAVRKDVRERLEAAGYAADDLRRIGHN